MTCDQLEYGDVISVRAAYMAADVPACFVDCMDVDYCSESDCYADCTSCQRTFVDEVLCGSYSYSYACGSYSFAWSEAMSYSLSYNKGHGYGSYGNARLHSTATVER